MKRKPAAQPDPVISEELLEKVKSVFEPDRTPRSSKCVVCGGDCAPNSTEGLCWVCRRLKISAWRDSDQQMSAQE